MNRDVRTASRFFVWRRQKIAGILDVFQDFLTKSDGKSAAKTCVTIYSKPPYTIPPPGPSVKGGGT